MKSVFALALFFVATSAFADNTFVCEASTGDLTVRLTGLNPNRGTGVMVLSNPQIGYGRRTIARFNEGDGTLRLFRNGAIGRVDRRYNDLNRGGELLAGTRLSEVKEVRLVLSDAGESDAELYLIKRNGTTRVVGLDCIN